MDPYAPRQWQPHEQPKFPGSPSTPLHPTHRRIAFGFVGVVVALTGGLSNALVTTNLPYLQGALGAYAWEMAWLPAAYAITNVSANLLLVKFRQQFGLRLYTEIFLILYTLIAFGHLFVSGLGSAIAVRAAHGFAGAALTTLGVYYMIQAFPARWRLKALVFGWGLSQLALPLASIFSIDLLQFAEWRGLYLFELGMALFALGCVLALKLPPGDRIKAFEKLDFVTFTLFTLGSCCLAAVLALGRYLWWRESAALGIALALAIVLLITAIAIEHYRTNPLISTRWLASGTMLRLALSILLIRIVLSEHSVGATGFMQAMGLSNDQMSTLSWLVLFGCVAGLLTSAFTLKPQVIPYHLLIAVACIAVGAFMDSRSNQWTRPENLYASQGLLAFGSTFFLAPAMLAGMGKVLAQSRNLISFIVLFGMIQSMGGLLGTALLGTLQIWREKYHSSHLVEHLNVMNPMIVERLRIDAAPYAHRLTDSAHLDAIGLQRLAAAATREATVLSYNDVFLAIGWIAIFTLAWILVDLYWQHRSQARAVAPAPSPTSPQSNA